MRIKTLILAAPLVMAALGHHLPMASATEACGVYENSGWITAEVGTTAPKVILPISVPEGAIGIESWQFGAEMGREAKVRLAVRLKVNGKMVNHWVSRESRQSDIQGAGEPLELYPGDVVELFIFLKNEGDIPQRAKANVWVYFRMGEEYPES